MGPWVLSATSTHGVVTATGTAPSAGDPYTSSSPTQLPHQQLKVHMASASASHAHGPGPSQEGSADPTYIQSGHTNTLIAVPGPRRLSSCSAPEQVEISQQSYSLSRPLSCLLFRASPFCQGPCGPGGHSLSLSLALQGQADTGPSVL